jgi:hypothetical protein
MLIGACIFLSPTSAPCDGVLMILAGPPLQRTGLSHFVVGGVRYAPLVSGLSLSHFARLGERVLIGVAPYFAVLAVDPKFRRHDQRRLA